MELLLSQSRWPEANCASCFQNNPLYVHSPHTYSKKNPQELNRNRHMWKNRSLTHAPQPTVNQISILPLDSLKCTIFSSCLTWLFENFLKHLHCCVMETLQLYGNCLIPVLVIFCSPGSLGLSLSLSLHRFIFPCAPDLHFRCCPGMPPNAHLLSLYDIPYGTTWQILLGGRESEQFQHSS